jgi:radical SAM-linked protein
MTPAGAPASTTAGTPAGTPAAGAPGAGRLRVRIRFSKLGKIRWTSHRDVARMWERAFRRERLPLAYSEGFSPRPKVSFGLALPTGYESVAEYIDVDLVGFPEAGVAALPARLSTALPEGVDATAAAVMEPSAPSLQEAVTSCTWRWAVEAPEGRTSPSPDDIGARVKECLAAGELLVTRNRKGVLQTDDIRPGIVDLEMTGPSGAGNPACVWLEAELACRPRAIRPSEVTLALGLALEERDVRRMNQWILRDGARYEPLPEAALPGAIGARHALERAS